VRTVRSYMKRGKRERDELVNVPLSDFQDARVSEDLELFSRNARW